MFTNRVQQYALQPSCLYQPGYASTNYHDSEMGPMDAEGANHPQWTTTNFPNPSSRLHPGYDHQLVIMNHNSYGYGNQILDPYGSAGQFPAKSSPDSAAAEYGGAGGPAGFAAFKSDGRRSSESAVAVSSDGLSGSESPDMGGGGQFTLAHNRAAAAAVAKAPQMLRADFEWMTKTSYQSQPNPGKTRTKDKYRVVYTDKQRLELEKEFHFNRYITIRRKAELAEMLGLSERQVKIWFQNRRAKERKQNKKKEELNRKNKDLILCQFNAINISSPNLLRPLPQFEHQNSNARSIAMY